MKSEEDKKWEEICREREKYKCTMTIDEMRKITIQNDRANGREPLTLEQINQYISEVRALKH